MRILDHDSDRAVKDISIYLTPQEAKQLMGYLKGLLEESTLKKNHIHLNDEKMEHEITFALYNTLTNLEEFDTRSKQLILKDI